MLLAEPYLYLYKKFATAESQKMMKKTPFLFHTSVAYNKVKLSQSSTKFAGLCRMVD